MSGIRSFHFIKKSKPFAGDMVTDRDIFGVRLKAHNLEKQLAPFKMRELGYFFDDLSETHDINCIRQPCRRQVFACPL